MNQAGGGLIVKGTWEDEGADRWTAWAVLSVVAEQGLERVTLEDIADRMERSRATLYREFGGLDGLYASAHQATLRDFSARFRGLRVGPPRMQIEEGLTDLRALVRSREGLAFRLIRASVASMSDLEHFRRREVEELEAMSAWLGQLVDGPHLRPDLVTELTALFWSLALGAVPHRGDPGPVTEEQLDLALRLLLPFCAPEEHDPWAALPDVDQVTALGDLL